MKISTLFIFRVSSQFTTCGLFVSMDNLGPASNAPPRAPLSPAPLKADFEYNGLRLCNTSWAGLEARHLGSLKSGYRKIVTLPSSYHHHPDSKVTCCGGKYTRSLPLPPCVALGKSLLISGPQCPPEQCGVGLDDLPAIVSRHQLLDVLSQEVGKQTRARASIWLKYWPPCSSTHKALSR